jgi:hypothetical protein
MEMEVSSQGAARGESGAIRCHGTGREGSEEAAWFYVREAVQAMTPPEADEWLQLAADLGTR